MQFLLSLFLPSPEPSIDPPVDDDDDSDTDTDTDSDTDADADADSDAEFEPSSNTYSIDRRTSVTIGSTKVYEVSPNTLNTSGDKLGCIKSRVSEISNSEADFSITDGGKTLYFFSGILVGYNSIATEIYSPLAYNGDTLYVVKDSSARDGQNIYLCTYDSTSEIVTTVTYNSVDIYLT